MIGAAAERRSVRCGGLRPGRVDTDNVVYHFHLAAGIFARNLLAQFLERRVVAAAIEPVGVVDQQDVIRRRILEQGVEFLFDRSRNVEVVAVEPEEAGTLKRGKKPWQNRSAVAFEDVDFGLSGELAPRAFRLPRVELDGVDFARSGSF